MGKFAKSVKVLLTKIKYIKNIKLIAGISVGVLVLAIAITILLAGMQSPPLTPAQQYIKLETNLLHSLINSVPDKSPDDALVTNIDILPADALLSLLGMEDMDWAQKFTVSMDAKLKDQLQETLWGFKLNDKLLLTANTIADPASGITYLLVPSISEHYLKIDDSIAIDTEGGAVAGSATAITDFLSTLNISETEVAKSLLNKYIDVFFAHMTEVDKQSEVIYIGDKTQTVDGYTNYITEKVFTNAFRAVLNEARSDVALKAVFPEDTDYVEMIDTMLSNLSKDPANDRNDAVVLKLYVDGDGHMVGRSLILPETEDSYMSVQCITVTDGDSTALKLRYEGIDMGYELMLDGNGNGTLSMVQPDQSVILANLAYTGTKENGTCQITLSDFIENTLLQSTELDPKLEIKWIGSDLSFHLYLSTERLVTVNTSTTSKEGPLEDITVPEASLDYSVQEEYEQYMQSIDWSVVRANLLDAGVPKNIIDFLLGKE
ncbi:MAG: hypothetical protein E7453_08570 [Ruminococcaceae bacterium]|nr:hypothetical protein [Oscillospiraceae bacterium]